MWGLPITVTRSGDLVPYRFPTCPTPIDVDGPRSKWSSLHAAYFVIMSYNTTDTRPNQSLDGCQNTVSPTLLEAPRKLKERRIAADERRRAVRAWALIFQWTVRETNRTSAPAVINVGGWKRSAKGESRAEGAFTLDGHASSRVSHLGPMTWTQVPEGNKQYHRARTLP